MPHPHYNNSSTLCPKKRANLASCSFDKRGLILIFFGKQHQHTFKNDMLIQLSFSLHFYLLCLLLNSCDGNEAFWRHSMLVKQSSFFNRKHRILCLLVCLPNSPVDPKTGRLYRIWRLMQDCVYIVQDTRPRHQGLDAAHQWHMGSRIAKHRSCW